MMKKTILLISGILIFLFSLWIILSSVLRSYYTDDMPDNYEITFGYKTNDSNFDFVDSAETFTQRAELKAKIAFPKLSTESSKGLFYVTSNREGKVVKTFNITINKGVSGQLFNLDAEDWPAGTYECTFEMNGEIVAENSFSLK